MRVRPYFRWFDLWIGVYVKRSPLGVETYVQPIPCCGLRFTWERYP